VNKSRDSTRVVLYARISEDSTGQAVGVRRQLDDGRALAKSRGWLVVAEATDNDISALRGLHRPGYERVLTLVRAGAVDHVVVWQTSRLLRNRRERAEAIELFGRQRVGILAVKGQDLDLSNAYGRGMAGMLGEFDTMESEVKSERVMAASAERARDGRPNGALGYGWQKSGTGTQAVYVEDPHAAGVVRSIVEKLLSGESIIGVTAALNAGDEPSPEFAAWLQLDDDERERRLAAGRKVPARVWVKSSVRKIALRPSNAALRVHHRGRPTEQTFPGKWPALVTERQHRGVLALLSEPTRRKTSPTRPGARRHLLTYGIGACGVCDSQLKVGIRGHNRYGTKQALYLCAEHECVGRNEAAVDELAVGVAIRRLAQPDALDWMLGDDQQARRAADRASELNGRLSDAADSFADGAITADQMRRITARLTPQIEAAEREQQSARASLDVSELRKLAGPSAAARWAELTIAQRRAVLETLGMRVTVNKVARRGPGFDPESVLIEWRA
jgi:site-specific DNA recombinase